MSDDKKSIMFNMTKRESHNPNNGFKKLFRKLRTNYKLQSNKDEISKEKLNEADVIVFGGPRAPCTKAEFDDMKVWLNTGGRLLIFIGDGGEKESGSNLNYFLEEYGLSVNSDSVVRSAFYKYLHPKEVFIAEGLLVPDLARKTNNINTSSNRKVNTNGNGSVNDSNSKIKSTSADKLNFVYPYGASLNVQRPARPLLSSGNISYPMNRPIAGFWEAETIMTGCKQRGRLVVIGSVEIFSDEWIDKEENMKLCDVLFAWLLNEIEIDMTSDRQDSDLNEYSPIPNIEALSQLIKPCLQGMEELPKDFTNLFDFNMFKFDVDIIPHVIKTYSVLNVPHEVLTLIPPQFECPLPKLVTATFPPSMRDPPPPALDQFDLDDHFANEDIRLAQLTNKCTQGSHHVYLGILISTNMVLLVALGEEDLEYYISESGEILGITQTLPFGERSAKHILFNIMKQVIGYKMSDGGSSVPEVKGTNSYH